MSQNVSRDVRRQSGSAKKRDFSHVYSNPSLVGRINEIERAVEIFDEQRGFGSLIDTSTSQMSPYDRWARYREAYSGRLVKELIRRMDLAPSKHFVLDPMCGSGSTLVASAQMGFDCLGSDVIPYSVDLSNAKTASYTTEAVNQIEAFLNAPISGQVQRMPTSWKTMDECRRYFRQENLQELSSIRDAIEAVSSRTARQLLFVAWLTILEDSSDRRKEGNGLATRRTRVQNVWSHFCRRVKAFLNDIRNHPLPSTVTAIARKASALEARSLVSDFEKKTGKQLGAVIFSPPYANSFDYFESYKLELLAGYYDSAHLVEARKDAIRNYRKGYRHQLTTKDELVRMLCEEVRARIPAKEAAMGRTDNRSRLVPNLLVGYFDDMERVLLELYGCMPSGSYCHIVVSQSSYLGVIIPTDLVLANAAMRLGFQVTQLIDCGKATTSAQQLRQFSYLTTMLRESILSLRKSY
jgi:hypothetical protein